MRGAMESVGDIFVPAWGSSAATGVGVGRGAAFVGAVLAAGRFGEGEAFAPPLPSGFWCA